MSDYHIDLRALDDWIVRAKGPGGTTFQTVGQVASTIITVCSNRPESLISGAPNRIVGTAIYWTATVDHEAKHILITNIEPDPRPGL